MRKNTAPVFAAIAFLAAASNASAVQIFQETFGAAGATQPETSFVGAGDDGGIKDFWQVLPTAPLDLGYVPAGIDGAFYWGGRDLDTNFGGQSGPNAQRFIDIAVDTSAYTNLSVVVALSARNPNGVGDRFEIEDFIEIIVENTTVDKFTGPATGSGPLANSANDILNQSFQDFSYGVSNTGLLNIRIAAFTDAGAEAVAIDNIRITGDLRQVPEPVTAALLGLGLAGIGYQRRKRATT